MISAFAASASISSSPAPPPSTCSSRCRSASTISAGMSRSICWATQIVETARSSAAAALARSCSTIWRAFLEPAGVDHPAFALVLKLLDNGRTWVKLSGAYMDTRTGPPTYADVSKVAQAYVKAAPERMVWGSDWPHPTEKADAKPDDAILFDLLADRAPDEAIRNRILLAQPRPRSMGSVRPI